MDSPGERLRARRKEQNLSAEELGRRAAMILNRTKPISESAVRNHENGTNGIPASVAEAYAKVLKTTAAGILFGDHTQVVEADGGNLREVPVLGSVQAGNWDSAVALDFTGEPEGFVSVSLPQFARANLFGLRVVGRSMDLEYPEGTRLVCCPTAEIGVREGDHVIVQRTKPGSRAETTVKEVSVEGETLVLTPRSSDPAYQTPIRIPINRDPAAQEGISIIGVVVAAYRVRQAQQGPLIEV